MFLRIGFTNWNIIEKYFWMNFLSSLSAKNDPLSLLCMLRVEAGKPIYFLGYHYRLLVGFLFGTLTVENRDLSSAYNLGLHWRLSEKSLLYITNKSGHILEPWGTQYCNWPRWSLVIKNNFLVYFLRSLLKDLINFLKFCCI